MVFKPLAIGLLYAYEYCGWLGPMGCVLGFLGLLYGMTRVTDRLMPVAELRDTSQISVCKWCTRGSQVETGHEKGD